jgi:hypothetical protein
MMTFQFITFAIVSLIVVGLTVSGIVVVNRIASIPPDEPPAEARKVQPKPRPPYSPQFIDRSKIPPRKPLPGGATAMWHSRTCTSCGKDRSIFKNGICLKCSSISVA